ncbi:MULTISPECIES: tyrosine-type recombinase/integrase [Candidatus Brocadia]|uniref:Integrase family protein n=1 Tax=Candidatus Brocadia sinica JPN1 TaxID=1197129 RepID=A0ABQ0K2N5_9BACT|nr:MULTISPECIES: site-specific integrase [Brocadia]GAN35022.1 integrase family protein [Candidatus Brocadia sinica JPN1]GIK12034.1 MAG: hypothetical protein BroJett002_07410 [Candidatus Brocadia sinica]GJQ19485.1 MAG: hypothetical protein HBSIN01_34440 [Candidatus Brocadia sinica]
MAVRWKKYYPDKCKIQDAEGKEISCDGKREDYCPTDLPIKKNGDIPKCGRWLIELFDDRKRWVSVSFRDVRSRKDAMKRLMVLVGDRERGKLQLPKKKVIPALAEYSGRYLELHKGAKENTLCAKKVCVNNLLRYLGNYQLDKITSFIVERFRIERKEKDQVKDSTINDDVKFLSHIFTVAMKEGIVDKNPCKEVKRLKVAQTKDRVLSPEEIKLILELPQDKDRMMILTALFTGMRLNEVLGLRWNDVDFARDLITFTQSKTGKLIAVPLSEYLRGELQGYRGNDAADRIFETRDITKAVGRKYSEHFSHLFKGLGIHNFTFHNLRHTFSSLQAELGTGAVVTKDLLGHSTLAMTLRYSHTNLDSKKKAIQVLTDHVLSMNNNADLAVAQ